MRFGRFQSHSWAVFTAGKLTALIQVKIARALPARKRVIRFDLLLPHECRTRTS